ncbi:LysR family transcriptional regulator [Sphingopyxis sp.]|uniref:LysR family transcriptional regulator n=1 Tax=Sphingopyxis sp. TaxID=1908224 RepID=UPI001DD66BD3|nr:LysR family transcriptional regulator [Sphingopyxis sp.]MBW8296362.1 LysR family transcriptional regulator [Sphingopyxis sp.]
MDLKHLKTFVAVAEELSFRKAAERLNLTQPPVSLQINALEHELGIKLLNRGRNQKISLTPAGAFFLGEARVALQTAENAVRDVRLFSEGGRGRLRFAYTDDFVHGPLPGAITAFHSTYPSVVVRHAMLPTDMIVRQLEAAEIDIGMVTFPIQKLDPGFLVHELPRVMIVAVVPAVHPLAGEKEIWLRELRDDPIYLAPSDFASDFSPHLTRLFSNARIRPQILGMSQSASMMAEIVRTGHAVALVNRSSLSHLLEGVSILGLRDPFPFAALGMIFNPANPNIRTIERFRTIVAERFGPTDAAPDFTDDAAAL